MCGATAFEAILHCLDTLKQSSLHVATAHEDQLMLFRENQMSPVLEVLMIKYSEGKIHHKTVKN